MLKNPPPTPPSHYLASTSASTVPPRTLAIEKAIGRWLDPDEIVVIETLGNGKV